MSSRLLSAAAMVLLLASGSALACPAAKQTSADGSSGSGTPAPTQQQRGG